MLEQGWGGIPSQRMEAKYLSFVSQYGTSAPKVSDDDVVNKAGAHAENSEAPVDKSAELSRPEEPSPAPPVAPLPALPAPPSPAATAR